MDAILNAKSIKMNIRIHSPQKEFQMPRTTRSAEPVQLPLFMSAREVAVSLGIARRTLDDLVAAGTVPQPIRLSRKTVRWSRAAIEGIVGTA